MKDEGEGRLAALAGLAVVLAGLFLAVHLSPYQIDDAFIAYRYAAQYLHEGSPVFNRGGEPVEGFTSPLWLTLLTALAAAFGIDALPAFGLLLGFLAFAGAAALVARLAGGRGAWVAAFVLAFWATRPDVVFHAVSGLETVLYLVVLLICAASLSGRLPLGAGLVAAGLALWARPEAAVLPFTLLPLAAVGPGSRRDRIRRWLKLTAALAVGGAVLLGIRWHLFGAWLPNTYDAKRPDLVDGLRYVGETLAQVWVWPVVVAGLLGAVFGGGRWRAFFAAGLLQVGVVVAEGGDWMPLGRLLLPATTFFALAAGGLAVEPEKGTRHRATRRALLLVPALVFLGVSSFQVLVATTIAHRSYRQIGHEVDLLWAWLRQAEAGSVGLVDIGRLGYVAQDLEIFDLGGLTDRHIARSPGGLLEKEFDLDYLFRERRPDVLVLRLLTSKRLGPGSYRPDDAASIVEGRILLDRRLRAAYRLRLHVVGSPQTQRLVFLSRTFSPRPEAAGVLPPASPDGVSFLSLVDGEGREDG